MTDDKTVDAELKARLVRYLDSLEGAVRAGGEAVATQGPEVARELVAYTLATSLLQAAAAAFLVGLAAYCARRTLTGWEDIKRWAGESDGALPGVTTVFITAAGCGGAVWWVVSVHTALKCYFAPKLFVLEYVVGLVRGEK